MECFINNKKSTNKSLYNKHFNIIQSKNIKMSEIYECEMCNYKSNNPSGLDNHNKTDLHQMRKKGEPTTNLTCENCLKVFKSYRGLRVHSHYCNIPATEIYPNAIDLRTLHKCYICNFITEDKIKYINHLNEPKHFIESCNSTNMQLKKTINEQKYEITEMENTIKDQKNEITELKIKIDELEKFINKTTMSIVESNKLLNYTMKIMTNKFLHD